jgi:hypothetical protein
MAMLSGAASEGGTRTKVQKDGVDRVLWESRG